MEQITDRQWLWTAVALWVVTFVCIFVGIPQFAWIPAGIAGFASGIWDAHERQKQ
jgi:hypothetical protein